MTLEDMVNRLILFRNLRLAGFWLIALTCLSLFMPTTCLATPLMEGPAKQSELIAQNFGAELLESPVEPTGISKHSTQCPETETISSNLGLADQLPSSEAGFLQSIAASRWLVSYPPQFLPRPPPLS